MKRQQRGNSKSTDDHSQDDRSDKNGKDKTEISHPSSDFEEECSRGQLIASIFGFIVLIIYVNTAFPTVASGDSGELCFTSCSLGVAHPPGYPLFIMVGFLFTKIIPFGSPGFRVNCVSCCCGTLSGNPGFQLYQHHIILESCLLCSRLLVSFLSTLVRLERDTIFLGTCLDSGWTRCVRAPVLAIPHTSGSLQHGLLSHLKSSAHGTLTAILCRTTCSLPSSSISCTASENAATATAMRPIPFESDASAPSSSG